MTAVTRRIMGYDLARALAIIGMVVVNFKIVMGASEAGPAWLVWAAGLLEGRAAATFVVLAGVGLSLHSRSARISGDLQDLGQARRTLLKRALFLFVVGLLYTPIWPADILHFYGLYVAIGAFCLAAPTRRLWGLATAFVLAFPLLLLFFDYERGWDWSTLYYEGFWTVDGMVRHLFFNGFHPVIPWCAFLLLGLILGRQNMLDTVVRRRVFAWGAGGALAAEAMSRVLVRVLGSGATSDDLEIVEALLGTSPMPPMPLYMLAGAGTSCAVIALCVELGDRLWDHTWLRPLVATGQLSLTLYVAHVVLGMGTLEALGLLRHPSLPLALASAAIFCALGVLFAFFWRRHFRRGPLEQLMRWVTRGS